MRMAFKAAMAVVAIAALLFLVTRIAGFMLVFFGNSFTDVSEKDPQFAEEAEKVTRPSYEEEISDGRVFEDRSAQWDTSVKTPVDQTADELMKEALSAAG